MFLLGFPKWVSVCESKWLEWIRKRFFSKLPLCWLKLGRRSSCPNHWTSSFPFHGLDVFVGCILFLCTALKACLQYDVSCRSTSVVDVLVMYMSGSPTQRSHMRQHHIMPLTCQTAPGVIMYLMSNQHSNQHRTVQYIPYVRYS